MTQSDIHFICRLRDDAELNYIWNEPPSKKRGRPRKHSGKVINKDYFRFIFGNEYNMVYAAKIYSKSLKRNIMPIHVTYLKANGKNTYNLIPMWI